LAILCTLIGRLIALEQIWLSYILLIDPFFFSTFLKFSMSKIFVDSLVFPVERSLVRDGMVLWGHPLDPPLFPIPFLLFRLYPEPPSLPLSQFFVVFVEKTSFSAPCFFSHSSFPLLAIRFFFPFLSMSGRPPYCLAGVISPHFEEPAGAATSFIVFLRDWSFDSSPASRFSLHSPPCKLRLDLFSVNPPSLPPS